MNLLAYGGSSHDFSATLIVDGRLKVMIEDERLDRIKHSSQHWNSDPGWSSIKYCLEEAERLSFEEIDVVYRNEDIPKRPNSCIPFSEAKTVGHHLCHASASYFTTEVESACLLVVDGHGGEIRKEAEKILFETVSMGVGIGLKLSLDSQSVGKRKLSSTNWHYYCDNSLGTFYKIITESLGFGSRGQGEDDGISLIRE